MDNFIATDEQWEKMKRHIKSDKYKKEDFFVFETLAIGDKIVPNRHLRITPELLKVMRDDAEKGVSLMVNHNWGQEGVQAIPVGKVFDGRIAGSSQDGETTTLYTTQYILKDDSKVDGYSKNDIIKLIETGTIADTSVGWGTTPDQYKCNICGNSIYDWRNCKHSPGNKYIVNEETDEVKECIMEAHPPLELHEGNNVLMENSLVFDGAYSNAIIQSAVGSTSNKNDKLKLLQGKESLKSSDVIIGYASGYNINLFCNKEAEKGGLDMEENEERVEELENEATQDNTPEENTEVEAEVVETEEVNAEEEVTEETTETPAEETYSRKDILEMFGNISDNVENLVSLAQEGLEIRNKVIENALNSGVRSMGNAFNKKIFENTFSNMKTKDIEEMANAWEEQVNEKFNKEKVSKQDFSNDDEETTARISLSKFKTSNY